MIKPYTLITAAVLTTMTGCANQQFTSTQKGAAIGAVVGAIAGKATGDHDKKRYAWGAVVGALAGAAIGNYMDQQEKAFREELADTGVDVVREGNNLRLIMPANITFSTNQSQLSPRFHPVLNDVALVVNKYDKTTLNIVGHTDSTGSSDYNQQLSEARAQSVNDFLIGRGVDARRTLTRGMGETLPVATNNTEAGREQNRRVELTIVPVTE